MTPLVAYQGRELELYAEALRVVPARTAARVHGREADAYVLIRGYLDTAQEMGIPGSSAWSILAAAAECIIVGLVNLVAEVEDVTQANVADRMVAAAVEQVATGAF